MNRSEAIDKIDPLVLELRKVDERLDGRTDPETGEYHGGLNDLLAQAEDEWLPHRDAWIAEAVEGEFKGRQLPGEDRLNALVRSSSKEARDAWQNFRHLQRMTKALRERATRLDTEIKGLQSIAKRPEDNLNANAGTGVPEHARRREMRSAA